MKDEVRYLAALESYRTIRPEHAEIHKSLQNSANWCRVGTVQRRTPSLEGRYRPPPCWHQPEPPNSPDINHAHRVEELIVSAPHDYGTHLRLWYIRRWPMKAAAKKLKIAYPQIEPHLAAAREYIKIALTNN
mgnify:CR=1 FL=1